MSDSAAEEWLAVAATDVAELPEDILAECCKRARRTCTHHGQIVPTILKESEDWMNARRNFHKRRAPPERQIEQSRWIPQEGELEAIKRKVAESLRVND